MGFDTGAYMRCAFSSIGPTSVTHTSRLVRARAATNTKDHPSHGGLPCQGVLQRPLRGSCLQDPNWSAEATCSVRFRTSENAARLVFAHGSHAERTRSDAREKCSFVVGAAPPPSSPETLAASVAAGDCSRQTRRSPDVPVFPGDRLSRDFSRRVPGGSRRSKPWSWGSPGC